MSLLLSRLQVMAEHQLKCGGHTVRVDRTHRLDEILKDRKVDWPEKKSFLIKKGPASLVETSLSDLEDIYKKKPEWIHPDRGGVLTVPVEELRVTNLSSSAGKD